MGSVQGSQWPVLCSSAEFTSSYLIVVTSDCDNAKGKCYRVSDKFLIQ